MNRPSKVGLVLRELHRAEDRMARELRATADRHRVDHEVFHVGHDIAAWSDEHVRRLDRLAGARGLRLGPGVRRPPRLLGAVNRRMAEALGRRHSTQLLLLADLRRLHRMAAGLSVDWELLAQVAQARKDRELFELASGCHPGTLRQLKWTNAMLKVNATQALST
jgi:hypothetical protein